MLYGMKWEKDENGNGILELVYYVCCYNGCIIEEVDKFDMVEVGEW